MEGVRSRSAAVGLELEVWFAAVKEEYTASLRNLFRVRCWVWLLSFRGQHRSTVRK